MSRWPTKNWTEINKDLKDPNNLFQNIDSIFGLNRKKDYFNYETFDYLNITFNKNTYLTLIDSYLESLDKTENINEIYNNSTFALIVK